MTDAPRKKAGASVSQVLDGEESSPVENISPADPATKPGELNDDAPADNLKPNPDAAIDWLRYHAPEGPWALTAIEPDGPGIATRTFGPKTEPEARRWIHERNAGRVKHNVYFAVNPLLLEMSKKAEETDVKEVTHLHVDVDPKKGEDFAATRERILRELRAAPVPPSAIVDSGGGYQAFWKLDKPAHIDGHADSIAETKAYNIYLRDQFGGGDSVQNLDRIMRLPGTVNWPSAKKRAAGRVPRLASVVERHDDRVYPLAAFTSAPISYESKSPAGGAPHVQISENLPRITLDELPEAVTPRTRMLIVQGDDPDDPTRYGSRSEVVWAVVCEMVRAGCTDDQIAAIITDPDYGISAHVLNQKRSMEYAARQIERAREEVIEPMLRRLNEDHAVIEMYGGKTKVVSWHPSEVDPTRLELVAQSFEDFRNRYMNVKVQTGTTKEGHPLYSPAGKWWLEHPMRRQYRSVVFRPNEDVDDREWNIWRGLAVTPKPGDWSLFRRLIVDGLAGGDESLADYIIRWSAYAVQHPEKQAEVALTLIGGKGSGKGTFGRIMCRIFGQHGVAVAGEKSLTSNFNKHLHGCCLLFADEAVPPGNRDAAGLVKSFITEPTIMIEPKGVDSFPTRNRLKVIISSNDSWVVDASGDERRYAVLNVSSRFIAPSGAGMDDERVRFWRNLNDKIDNGEIEAAFLHDLLALDLGDWHPRYDVPQTSALNEQRAASLKGFDRIWFDILVSGELPPLTSLRKLGGDHFMLPTTQLEEYWRKVSRSDDVSKNRIGNILGAGQPDKEGVIHRPGMGFEKWERGGPKGWAIPPLLRAREAWSARRFPFQWDETRHWAHESSVIDGEAPGASPDSGSPY